MLQKRTGLAFQSSIRYSPAMATCRHQELVLLRKGGKKLRCRRCHLTIGEEELGEGYCPECREVHGERSRDFEVITPEDDGAVAYRCEGCGALIKVD